jgi:ABC-type dipeptide/oligopeptide/nickel transport system permease subunit
VAETRLPEGPGGGPVGGGDEAASATKVRTRSRWADIRRIFVSNRLALFGLVVIAIFALMAIFAPLLAPYDPVRDQALSERFAGPSAQHPLGQDELGRDVLSRIIYGARISLTAGLAAVAFATVGGTIVGLVAGYAGGWTDATLMRLMDVLLAFPSILLAIVVVSILGQGLTNALLAVGIILLPQMARVVRSAVISVRERDYVEAERAIGASNYRIVSSAILPNSMAPLIVQASLALATAVLDIAALSFLGLGATPPSPEWGAMLTGAFRSGFGVFTEGQHAIIFPGVAIALSVLAVNFIGDGLRDALDPRRRR